MEMMARSVWILAFAILVVFCTDDGTFIPMTGNNNNSSGGNDGAQSNGKRMTFLALGDSYTIGESVEESGRWPVQLVKKINGTSDLRFDEPDIIARTGWRTDQLKQAIKSENPSRDYDMVSLLIGVNDQYQGMTTESYEPKFRELLDITIQHASGDKDKVFVVSIPDYGYTPFGESNQEKISSELDQYNAINKRLAEERGVRYYYITDISRRGLEDPGLVASDRLHPSAKQYGLWVNLILSDKAFLDRLTK